MWGQICDICVTFTNEINTLKKLCDVISKESFCLQKDTNFTTHTNAFDFENSLKMPELYVKMENIC